MENKQSTSGMLEDLIRSMVQVASTEVHAKTALEKAEHEVSIAEVEDLPEVTKQLTDAEDYLKRVTELRRNVMRLIAEHAKELNPTKWCEVKHTAMAMYTAFEAYQADGSIQLYNYYMETNDLFIEVMSDFLGLDIPPCAACFSDALKGA